VGQHSLSQPLVPCIRVVRLASIRAIRASATTASFESTMSTGRPCSICSSTEKTRIAGDMIAAGASDQAIADRLGSGLHHMAVSRHRRNHIEKPAAAIAKAAAKGRDVVEERAQTLAAAEAGDPAAFVALANIVNDLRKVHERLERTASAAENDQQRLAVASLAAQQLRATEVRAKLGGLGGYATQRTPSPGEGATLTINFNFSRGRETISATVLDADTIPPAGPGHVTGALLPFHGSEVPSSSTVADLLECEDVEREGA
jgi:hypothetical protein